MRSPGEIAFRLRQESANLWLLTKQPAARVYPARPELPLPNGSDVASPLRDGPYAEELLGTARGILSGRLPLLGIGEVNTGSSIAWRRDYCSGRETGTSYFRTIPYLDFERAGDHKIIWEVNRHQHLVLLCQAWLLSGEDAFLHEVWRQLASWWEQNPFQRGINWASALEVAFRALSWLWIDHWAGTRMPADFRRRFLDELYRHGCHLQYNLSVYFSPNTHLLGEAVVLHALGRAYPQFPDSARWRRTGHDITVAQMTAQVREDGGHFEQSTYYHLYAIDFFLLHALLADVPDWYRAKLERMGELLDAVVGPHRRLPLIGDDDGGRLFHPYGPRDRFARATLASLSVYFDRPEWSGDAEDNAVQQAWWMGRQAKHAPAAGVPRQSRLFPDTGLAVMETGDVHIVVKTGGFGPGSGGHSHSDVLSLVCSSGGAEVLVDAGTYTYVGDPAWRTWFRGSTGHNTLRIAGREQAIPAGPFRWTEKPSVEMRDWSTQGPAEYLDCACTYGGYTHRRRVVFVRPSLLVIVDTAEWAHAGSADVEQFWHLGPDADAARLLLASTAASAKHETVRGGQHGWRSYALGGKVEAPVLRVSAAAQSPVHFAAAVDFTGKATELGLTAENGEIRILCRELQITLPDRGLPRIGTAGHPA